MVFRDFILPEAAYYVLFYLRNLLYLIYLEEAVLYNILPIENDRYIFTVFVSESSDVDMAKRADFYTIDLNSDNFAEPIIINGEHLQQSVMLGKLFLLEYSGIPKNILM